MGSNLVPRLPPPTGNKCTNNFFLFKWEERAWGRGSTVFALIIRGTKKIILCKKQDHKLLELRTAIRYFSLVHVLRGE